MATHVLRVHVPTPKSQLTGGSGGVGLSGPLANFSDVKRRGRSYARFTACIS